jgi:CRP/FNR family transcriptional regulator, anaerobic regulatory protein
LNQHGAIRASHSIAISLTAGMITSSVPGPSLRAASFGPGLPDVVRLLSSDQRAEIASIATVAEFPPGRIVYREGTNAQTVFIVAEGAVKVFRDLPSGRRRVMAFLFADDAFGLAQTGHYVHSVQTITRVTLYRIRAATLGAALRSNGELASQFLCKVTHELRGAMRHNLILARRDAVGRLAMFLMMLEHNAPRHDARIDLPMSRSDIANYLGLSQESVSRALSRLERTGVIAFHGRHELRILDRPKFEKIVNAL